MKDVRLHIFHVPRSQCSKVTDLIGKSLTLRDYYNLWSPKGTKDTLFAGACNIHIY